MNATNAAQSHQRAFPPEMWTEILNAEVKCALSSQTAQGELRSAILEIARKHGFTEHDCITCGLLHPPRKPNPFHLKGGR